MTKKPGKSGISKRRGYLMHQSADSHITAKHRASFEAMLSGKYDNFALYSCFLDGKPAVAICSVDFAPETPGALEVLPLWVSVIPGMVLTNQDGENAGIPMETLQ